MAVPRQRALATLTVLAFLALSVLGLAHAAEHDVRHESTSCEACLAIAAPGAICNSAPTIGRQPDAGALSPNRHEFPTATHRATHDSARAPPSRHN